MHKSVKRTNAAKLFFITPLVLMLGACASVGKTSIPSAQIKYPPAIEVAYSQVVDNIAEHHGTNVRWGGQIIAAEDVGDITRLTVLAMPLAENGKPSRHYKNSPDSGRFIIEMRNFDERSNNQLITVYGQIIGEEILTNGKKKKSIPIVSAMESKDWGSGTRSYAGEFHLGLPYNGLGYGYYDRGYYGSYYGSRYSRYGSYYSLYPYGYVSRGRRYYRHGGHH